MDDNPWGTESPPTVVSTLIATPTSTGTKALSQHDDDIVGTVLIDAEEALEQEREEEREKDNAIIASTLTPSLEESIPAVSVAVETPMDDFSDDDETTMGNAAAETEGAHELIADDDAFDEDDFGEMGGDDANDDDDFGDFGDVDSTAFEPAVIEHFPVASTSAIPYPPLQLDLSTPTALAMAPQLDDFFERMYPRARETLSDEPERQVDGIGQVLVTESLRSLLTSLSSLPPLKPVDWRRSRIRRAHLIALGVPVNLDDSAESKPLASLVLPSQLSATRALSTPTLNQSPTFQYTPAGSPRPASTPLQQNTSASGSNSLFSLPPAQTSSRHSLPPPPILDKEVAHRVISIGEADLKIMSLAELEILRDRLEQVRFEASATLEYALLVREKEVGDAEIYNGMIQDLVVSAAKMKTSSMNRSVTPTGTSRWGRKNVVSSTR